MADSCWSAAIGSTRPPAPRHDVVDDGLEQLELRAEVVVEGAPRGVELVQDVLDAHLLVALGLDQAQPGLDEGLAPDGTGLDVHRAGQGDRSLE
jgi:hypothetical protein